MATQPLAARVDSLEPRVTCLEELPARVDALAVQVSQLRDEMRAEFSAVRTEIRAGDENTCRTLREEIQAGDEETRRTLRDEIRAGGARVMEQARVLHEEVISRLALIQEGVKARGNVRGRRKG